MRKRRKRRNKALQVVLICLICLCILVAFGVAAFAITSSMGNKKLRQQATTNAPVLIKTEPEELETELESETEIEKEEPLKEGEIIYNGQKYRYNEEILTFAIMGIDYMGTVDELLKESMGGHSDMNFLAVINPRKKSLELIAINRNSMTQIHRYATDGSYVDTVDAQITLQHAYGTGGADSCEKMVAAIDNLMYMIPIHGYFSMNMGAIMMLNDAVGGVELVAVEDVIFQKTDIRRGDKVVLLGKDAFWYVKYRDVDVVESANGRLQRQKQYINAFIQKMKHMIKQDLSLPIDLYKIVAEYSVTDITIDEMTYLVSQVAGYSFDLGNIHTVPGETVVNGEYEEFYVDEDGLYEMIVDLFYEPVME